MPQCEEFGNSYRAVDSKFCWGGNLPAEGWVWLKGDVPPPAEGGTSSFESIDFHLFSSFLQFTF